MTIAFCHFPSVKEKVEKLYASIITVSIPGDRVSAMKVWASSEKYYSVVDCSWEILCLLLRPILFLELNRKGTQHVIVISYKVSRISLLMTIDFLKTSKGDPNYSIISLLTLYQQIHERILSLRKENECVLFSILQLACTRPFFSAHRSWFVGGISIRLLPASNYASAIRVMWGSRIIQVLI